MNINFEAIEKAWFKPKNSVLDELEEWLGNVLKRYIFEISNLSDDLREFIRKEALKCSLHQVELVLDKIQELKKEMK